MYGQIPHPDASFKLAEPINGIVITPNDHDDYCLNCSHPLTFSPAGYWFHYHTKDKNCRGSELLSEGIHQGL